MPPVYAYTDEETTILQLDFDAESEDDSDYLPDNDIGSDDEPECSNAASRNPTLQADQRGARTMPSDTASRVQNVLDAVKENGFADFAMFMDAFLWGEESCTSDRKITFARTGFTASAEFPIILRRLWKPPGGYARTSSEHIDRLMEEYAKSKVLHEMEVVAPLFTVPDNQDPLALKTLTGINFAALTGALAKGAPFLWFILLTAGWTERQAKKNTRKTPENIIMTLFSMLSYTRSHKRNRVASFWAIYLKSCGLGSRAYDALHAAGLIMSIKWTNNAYRTIAERQLKRMCNLALRRCWLLAYDNCQIPKRVFSMRTTNQPMFYSACAGTIFVFPEHIVFPERFVHQQQARRIEGAKSPFDLGALLSGTAPGSEARDQRVRTRYVWVILQTLLDSPEFTSYPQHHRCHPLLSPPAPVLELPADLNNTVEQFMLKTEDIEEASYVGNKSVLAAFLWQLGISSPEDLRKLGEDRIVWTAGDQLTIERLTGLARICHENVNGYERYDWVYPMFGWFHLVMAFANSIFTQYQGTSAGPTLRRAFDLMERKGLHKTQTQGLFWHHLDEALHQRPS